MNPEVKVLWLNALKSGEYKKGIKTLRGPDEQGDKFCCLGVLCDLYIKQTGNGKWYNILGNTERSHFTLNDIKLDSAFLPLVVQEWAGIDNPSGSFNDTKKIFDLELGINSLVAVNDAVPAEDFSEVSKAIEEYF